MLQRTLEEVSVAAGRREGLVMPGGKSRTLGPASEQFTEAFPHLQIALLSGIGGRDASETKAAIKTPEGTTARVFSLKHLVKREELFIACLLDPTLRSFRHFHGAERLQAHPTYNAAVRRLTNEACRIAEVCAMTLPSGCSFAMRFRI